MESAKKKDVASAGIVTSRCRHCNEFLLFIKMVHMHVNACDWRRLFLIVE